jgi:hypothetical protein
MSPRAAAVVRSALVAAFGIGLAGAVALALSHAPTQLARLEVFKVREVVVEGVRWTRALELRQHLALPDSASVWHELEPWAQRLAEHDMIVEAEVRRRLPSTLVFRVVEREPVALMATPELVPVDRDGRELPLDPAGRRVDLPVLEPSGSPTQTRALLQALDRMRVDPDFYAALSAVEPDETGGVVAYWGRDPQVTFRLGLPIEPNRLDEAVKVVGDALQRFPDRPLREVDLRFVEQVVIRF